MTMTRKDFQAIARKFAEERPDELDVSFEVGSTWAKAVLAIAEVCRESNPNFNTEKFLDACYARLP